MKTKTTCFILCLVIVSILGIISLISAKKPTALQTQATYVQETEQTTEFYASDIPNDEQIILSQTTLDMHMANTPDESKHKSTETIDTNDSTDIYEQEKDTVEPVESMAFTIYEQMLLDAGYGVVVDIGDYDFGILTHNDGYVNGLWGSDILWSYLENQGLTATSILGYSIQESADLYCFIAYDVHGLITPEDETFWD